VTATVLKASAASAATSRYVAAAAAGHMQQQVITWRKSLFAHTFRPKRCVSDGNL
jgi:hypothetical protein